MPKCSWLGVSVSVQPSAADDAAAERRVSRADVSDDPPSRPLFRIVERSSRVRQSSAPLRSIPRLSTATTGLLARSFLPAPPARSSSVRDDGRSEPDVNTKGGASAGVSAARARVNATSMVSPGRSGSMGEGRVAHSMVTPLGADVE
ncbi:Uncharacterised protein [Mycobacteroides abscessus subsp. abscessus]|nr:Uncharacterised protein [Mycobacteroides abscessus subsp. abscessus]